MSVSDEELLHHLARLPLIDAGELAMITGEAHVIAHRALTGLLSKDTLGLACHDIAHKVEWRQ